MNGVLLAGVVLTVVGVVGYAVGTLGAIFAGRAFTVTAVMLGIALLAIGQSGGDEE